jgi:hypothetical protein
MKCKVANHGQGLPSTKGHNYQGADACLGSGEKAVNAGGGVAK